MEIPTSLHPQPTQPSLQLCLIAGAVAGTSVDTVLFPLDTIKTRLQSPVGFQNAGGFRGVFRGIIPAFIGSAPGASTFFVTYEYVKGVTSAWVPDKSMEPAVHMLAASVGEVSACVIRVPTEVVKQRLQANQYSSTLNALRAIIRSEGVFGFYRGYFSTVLREIPFTCVQFPLYEYFKRLAAYRKRKETADPLDAAICGSVAGGIAAAVTTPLDVIKTRIMLASRVITPEASPYVGVLATLREILRTEGPRTLFRGIGPRTAWISIGGFVFLGTYEKTKTFLTGKMNEVNSL